MRDHKKGGHCVFGVLVVPVWLLLLRLLYGRAHFRGVPLPLGQQIKTGPVESQCAWGIPVKGEHVDRLCVISSPYG